MTTTTMTLTDFLSARLDDDEAAARAASEYNDRDTWSVGGEGDFIYPEAGANDYVAVGPWGGGIGDPAAHIARHDPARVLREVEAKRRLLRAYQDQRSLNVLQLGNEIGLAVEAAYLVALSLLASAWSDNPDYREEWRP